MPITYISGVAMILLNHRHELLLLLREQRPDITFPGYWTLPGGHIRRHEPTTHAAYREMQEETGLSIPLIPWIIYRRQHDNHSIVNQALFYGMIDNQPQITLGEEIDFSWVPFDKLKYYQIGFGFLLPVLRFFREHPYLT